MQLSDKIIAKLTPPAGKTEYVEWDDELPRFGIRIRAGSKPTFIIQYKDFAGDSRKLKVGDAALITTVQAREKAKKLLAKVELGEDPQEAKRAARVKDPNTLGAAVEGYLVARESHRGTKGNREASLLLTHRYIGKTGPQDYFHPLYSKPLKDITVQDIAHRRSVIESRGGKDGKPTLATGIRAKAAISAVFTWAIRQGMTDRNPAVALKNPTLPSRDRVFTEAELAEIWNSTKCTTSAFNPFRYKWGNGNRYNNIVHLLVLTGCRKMEIGGLRWSEIDLEKGLITIPSERMKGWIRHVIPITPPVAEILRSIERRDGDDYVFGNHFNSGRSGGWFREKTNIDQRILRDRLEKSPDSRPIAHWSLHDIRRTVATMMSEKLKIQPHIIEAVLSHTSGTSVARIYNRDPYLPEKAAALAQWADYVMNLVGESERKVISMGERQAS